MRLTQIVEALLFASDAPLTAADLARADDRLDEDTVTAIVQELRAEFDRGERAFQIEEVAGGYQMLTRAEFAGVLDRYRSVPQSPRLSMAALEVLAIIAYRQPLGRLEIEEIRGVQSSAVLRTLQDRELIEPVARGEGLGRPLLYGTTSRFLEHFGFESLESLPSPDALPVVLRAVSVVTHEAVTTDPAEPTPLSAEAEAEAMALALHVHRARPHDPDAEALAGATGSLQGDGDPDGEVATGPGSIDADRAVEDVEPDTIDAASGAALRD
ncbi:MAG: SMC-Scp complex subunit ScpB [Gemmatimonadetes bacterium]|nr:SMC-Scp complex subunit ScpB [Gemmatimonadota bacterium]